MIGSLLERLRARWRRAWRKGRSYTAVAARFAPHLGARRRRASLAVTVTVAYLAMRLLDPWPLKLVIDGVLLQRPLPDPLAGLLPDPAAEPLRLLTVLVATIVCISLAGGLFYYLQRLLAATLGQEVSAALRLDLYSHIQRLSFSFHDRRKTGDLIVRLTSDIRMLREALIGLPLELLEHVLLAGGMLVVMLFMDWQLTLVAMLLVPTLGVLIRRYRRPMKRAIRQQREREGHLATLASETLGAVRVVQGFRAEGREIKRFGSQNRRSLRSGVKAARLEAKFKWSADFAVGLVTAAIVLVAARRVLAGTLSPGDLIVFVSYLRIYARPLRRISRVTERMLRATAAGERVVEILETEASVRDLPGATRAPRLGGEVTFDHVWFAYRKQHWALRDVSLHVAPGERVAVVGPTGSGKSTLVSLIPRFYDATRGRVCLDGRDVRDLTLASLREQVSLVFQEPVLFATSIGENIAYGRSGATMEEVVRAAERAGIHRIVSRLPEGYETVVGERGGTLSGGQRQCVAIARAMIRDAPLVILDEPTTGLDNESAALVMEALRELMKDRTVVLISHQLEGLADVDRVVVVDRGRIVEEGSHDVLLGRGGLYATLHGEGRRMCR